MPATKEIKNNKFNPFHHHKKHQTQCLKVTQLSLQMPISTKTFEQSFVSSLYLRRSKTNNSALKSKVVKNFTKSELHRFATKRKGVKPISSFAAFPCLYKKRQGPLKKLIRTVDPLEYMTVPGLKIADAASASVISNHFDLNATPASPQSRRRKRRLESSAGSPTESGGALNMPLELDSDPITVSIETPVPINDGSWDLANNPPQVWTNNAEEDGIVEQRIPPSFNLEGADVMPVAATAAALATTLTTKGISSPVPTRIQQAKLKNNKRFTTSALLNPSKKKSTTYGTGKKLNTVSALPCWPKRSGSSFFMPDASTKKPDPRDALRSRKMRLSRKTQRKQKIKRNSGNNKNNNGKHVYKPNLSRAEDKSINMSTRLALMPRPLSRSASYNGVAIIRSRPGTSDDFWTNEILPWNEEKTGSGNNNINNNNNRNRNNVGVIVESAMETQVIDRRPSSAKQREAQFRTYQRWEASERKEESQSNTLVKRNMQMNSSVRINISVFARLATVNMSFEVNSKVLKRSSNGWTEVEVGEELMTAMHATLDRDAKNLLKISARKAAIDWQDSEGKWYPLTSGAAMKNCIHERFHNLDLGEEKNALPGLSLIIRLSEKREPEYETTEPRTGNTPTNLSVHDSEGMIRNILQSRSSSRGASRGGSRGGSRSASRGSARQSLSRNMNRDTVKKLSEQGPPNEWGVEIR